MKNRFLLFFLVSLCFQNSIEAQKEGTIEKIGDFTELSLPAMALTMTIVKKDKEGIKQLILSEGINLAITLGLKTVIDKERPIMNDSSDSFPSGHTAIAVHSATFIYKRYGWQYGLPALAASAFVGYSRIHADKHDEVDVLFGALIGAGSAFLMTTPFEDKNIEVHPELSSRSVGMRVLYEF